MIETKFKQTEIGLIPEDWTVKRLGDIGKLAMCKRIYQEETSPIGDVPFYKIGTFGSIPDAYISQKRYNYLKDTYRFPAVGDILISAAGTIGRTVVYDGKPAYFQDSNIVWLSHNEKEVLNQYLFYVYRNIRWGTENTTIARLYNDIFENTLIVFPAIEEQQCIATALSDVDTLISALDKKIAKKKLIKQGAMQQLLTGKKRLQGFTEPWKEKRLGEILQYEQPTKYIVSSTAYKANGIPVLTAGKTFILGHTHEYWGIYHNVPVIIFDDFVTESKYVTFPFKVKSSAIKILSLIDSNNSLRYVYEIMQTIDFPMTDHKRYWIKEYSQQTILLPPYDEQKAIASVLSSMDKEIANLEAKRAKYEQIKQGMMQQLLTGKIRLIDK